MGYSCTKAASEMLGLIRHTFTDGETSNGLCIRGRRFFYEIGREQADGSITGVVFEHQGADTASKVGSFKIHADGVIVRFPRIKQNQRVALKFRYDELLRTDPAMLSLYSHGGI